ncbi:MAG: hypothetical protein ACRD36_14395, partial [Candidatus Acidiferrum sp.]
LLGDVPSPPLMGYISDHSSLQLAFLPVMLACALSGAILFYGMRYAPESQLEELDGNAAA